MQWNPWLSAVSSPARRSGRVISFIGALTSVVLSLGTAMTASAGGIDRTRVPERVEVTSASQLPLTARADERTEVVVVMSNESVAQVRARNSNLKVNAQDHAAIHAQLAQQHAAIAPSIVSRGGQVLRHYYDALNGMRVEIARSEIAGLRDVPGVTAVLSVGHYRISNSTTVPYIGVPQVWQGTPSFKGEHIKIAMIDTGIDYTHADFGGPGTVAAFQTALANDAAPPDPTLVGPDAPKVKGGIDLVGDAYNADVAGSVPVPDPNPLDCNGHGSHTSGTAAGFGVALDGTTYRGPYNQAAYSTGFKVGPGVAPLADIYAVKVFGCKGSTNVVADAIDWAVHNEMDVISMSLGSPYGDPAQDDAAASDAASKAGVIVAAAAGNSGPAVYITGNPAVATRAISVAAIDSHQFLANGVIVTLSGGVTAGGINENQLPLPTGPKPVTILLANGRLGLGCNASDFAGVPAGGIVVLSRGSCTFQLKMNNAMAVHASAVVLVNNTTGFVTPAITGVTIPFVELQQADGPKFITAPPNETATLVAGNVPNAAYRMAASFTSGGPRVGDASLKPDISGPGVDVVSAGMGTGNAGVDGSGTSMATPHVAGVAALTLQAHPNWTERASRTAILETGSPSALLNYTPRLEGMGLVQAVPATQTTVTVMSPNDGDMGPLSFGVAELTQDFQDSKELLVRNESAIPATFNVSVTKVGGVPHTISVSKPTIAVSGNETGELQVSINVPAATVGGTHDAQGNLIYEEAAGYITLTPVDRSSNGGIALRVPYYLVPRSRSNVAATLSNGKQPAIHLDNRNAVLAGNGDFYVWGLRNPKTSILENGMSPRAVGVQSNLVPGATAGTTDSVLVFAINSYQRFSTLGVGEYDIRIDVDGDGKPDFVLFSADVGLVTTGNASGKFATFVFSIAAKRVVLRYPIEAPTDGSTTELYAVASDLGITPANPQFSYTLAAFDNFGNEEDVAQSATFNVFNPALTNALFVPVAPNTAADVPVTVDTVQLQKTPALGFMVVTEDNESGPSQANLLPAPNH